MQYIKELIKLSATPISIYYPIPIVPLLIFSLSNGLEITLFLKLTLFSFLFFAAINLWNHVNDVEEDILSGRINILSENKKLRKIIIGLCIILYLLSAYLVVIWSTNSSTIFYHSVVIFLTWIYSDKMILGRYFMRFKENYMTELITYALATPLFVIVLWNLASPTTYQTYALSFLITFFALWALFLKDIKDISGDKLAGLNTIALKFGVEKSVKISMIFLTIFYFSFLIFSVLGLFPRLSILCFLLIFNQIYVINRLAKNDWCINPTLAKPLNLLSLGNVFSLILLSTIGLLFKF